MHLIGVKSVILSINTYFFVLPFPQPTTSVYNTGHFAVLHNQSVTEAHFGAPDEGTSVRVRGSALATSTSTTIDGSSPGMSDGAWLGPAWC